MKLKAIFFNLKEIGNGKKMFLTLFIDSKTKPSRINDGQSVV